ncbi:hypothetical protein COU20_03625 [Candidatus Kaiserbacteria bacterium CG10_big_fil_rev_8_21_14_0_10_59_10]|uniref:DUF7282 domain-containing protein n=1 Tax=Candidatus Kaiserbacteria bacterium CG10_big_fil_rev_8_21_14_0_10_59_10 TaxID=1974612 RepID=A0A2H0U7A6_9BACT|nr:MAG: hypothetical protein COU20_03625 [Candidatus Kaiserbacteria bacterium CG10_big_fil_rev_8_21_14_0_10_59_10]
MTNDVQWQHVLLGVAAGILIGSLATWLALSDRAGIPQASGDIPDTSEEQDLDGEQQGTSGGAQHSGYSIAVSDQLAGRSVTVQSVTLTETGWIAVRERAVEGRPGNVLGAARRDAGVYEEVSVTLLRATEAGGSYEVVVYRDDGDRVFDMKKDTPLEDTAKVFRALSPFSTNEG